MQVEAVMLDDIMQQPQVPEFSMLVQYETRSLRCGLAVTILSHGKHHLTA
jgi:hypothetical protein